MSLQIHASPFSAEYELAAFGRWRDPREAVDIDARIDRGGLDRALCKVSDLSRRGARLMTFSALREGMVIWLTLPRVGQVAAVVRWADDFEAGCEFRYPLTQDDYAGLTAA